MADDQNPVTSPDIQDAGDDAAVETPVEPSVTVEALNQSIAALDQQVKVLEAAEEPAVVEHVLPHNLSDTTVIRGYTIPLPLYTVIYLILGTITILEVLISSFPHSIFTTIPLIIFSLIKASLVVLFFMHLREDSRMFAFALALPIFIALVASIFLLSVPTKGY